MSIGERAFDMEQVALGNLVSDDFSVVRNVDVRLRILK